MSVVCVVYNVFFSVPFSVMDDVHKTHAIGKYTVGEYSLSMRMETGIRETLALVLAKKATVAQHDVIDLVAGAFAVQPMPFFRRLLALPFFGW